MSLVLKEEKSKCKGPGVRRACRKVKRSRLESLEHWKLDWATTVRGCVVQGARTGPKLLVATTQDYPVSRLLVWDSESRGGGEQGAGWGAF